MSKNFERKELQLREQGRLFEINGQGVNGDIYFAWYALADGKKKVITSSASLAEEGAILKLKQFKKSVDNGSIPAVECGICKSNYVFSNFDFSEKDENSFIGEDCSKRFAKMNKNVVSLRKPKFSEDEIMWNNLCTKDFIVLDAETTGIKNTDEVIEVAAIKVENYKIVDQYQAYIIPTIKIPQESINVHGITNEFIRENGRDGRVVFQELEHFIGDLGCVGHNVSFDKKKIEYHSKKIIGYSVKINIIFDTLQISRRLMQMPDHKLENIINRLNLREGLRSHSALDDVVATARYAALLKEIYRDAHHPMVKLF